MKLCASYLDFYYLVTVLSVLQCVVLLQSASLVSKVLEVWTKEIEYQKFLMSGTATERCVGPAQSIYWLAVAFSSK